MFQKKYTLVLGCMTLVVVQLACNFGTSPTSMATPNIEMTLSYLSTAAAQTLVAGVSPMPSATPVLESPTASETSAPATATRNPETATPVKPCDLVRFEKDVSYPDGSVVEKNKTFVKTWKLTNAGTCSWTPSYALVFFSGDAMKGPAVVSLSKNVNPGESIELSVTLTAPEKKGSYRGYWKLRNAAGVLFGFGKDANSPFWVDIKVGEPEYTFLSLVDTLCKAKWENNNGVELPCPGDGDEAKGFVEIIDEPVNEDGSDADVWGLMTVPPSRKNGFMQGQYRVFEVKEGDRFRAVLQCAYKARKCDMIFRLDYQNNGKTRTLGSWEEVYDGRQTTVDLDLSNLAGETIKLILVVDTNGTRPGDYGVWLNPRVMREGPAPAASQTAAPSKTPANTPTP